MIITTVALTSAVLPIAATAVPASAVRAPGAHPVAVPAAGRAVNTTHPTRWVGRGTPASCTSAAFVAAVRAGGIIRFRCGAKPVKIHLTATAKLSNRHARVVIDGRNLVTLDGGSRHRILYLDTCDPAQTWTTSLPGPGDTATGRAEPDPGPRQLDRARL